MAFYGYKGDVGNCDWTPYSGDFTSTPIQSAPQYSSPSYEPQFIDYNNNFSTYHTNEASATSLELNHSGYTYAEPQIVQYDPIEHLFSYNSYESNANPSELFQDEAPPKFKLSSSVSEFNEADFEEYDPTPYGGGYDPVTTYGKSLPPSDQICYPKSVPKPDTIANFSYNSNTSHNRREDDIPAKPSNGAKQIDPKPDPKTGNGIGVSGEVVEPSDVMPSDKTVSQEHGNGFGNGLRGDYGYESERQMGQLPYGSGLEAMDLCESLFGHWPCVAKREREQQQKDKLREACDRERRDDPWNTVADYLFGSPVVYNYENYYR